MVAVNVGAWNILKESSLDINDISSYCQTQVEDLNDWVRFVGNVVNDSCYLAVDSFSESSLKTVIKLRATTFVLDLFMFLFLLFDVFSSAIIQI